MTVGFCLVDHGSQDAAVARACAAALTASARKAMPGVTVVQFSDPKTRPVDGVDAVFRLPDAPLAVLRLTHQAAVDGEWLFLDTDVLIQRDVRHVFDAPEFEIAVTTRNWPHLPTAIGFADRMPINAGVVFSRSPAFWREAAAALATMSTSDQAFMGHQQVIADLAASGRYRVALLNGARYNLPPYVADKNGLFDEAKAKMSRKLTTSAAILHFKGKRKDLMLRRARKVLACA